MKLYIMRHGPAEDYAPSGRDADRVLTATGRERVRSVARALTNDDEAPLAILSSPLARALQTAEIVAAVTALEERGGTVEARREMAPGGAAPTLVDELVRAKRRRVMIVGHEPDLSSLVAHLVGQPPPQGMLKAMVVGISIDLHEGAERARPKLRFILDPKTLQRHTHGAE